MIVKNSEEKKEILQQLKSELNEELQSILSYWKNTTVDEINGGFFGRIDNDNNVQLNADKGLVLNARILWSFSSAYIQTKNEDYLTLATRAFEYINKYFLNKKNGGVYWMLDAKGKVSDNKKQIYGIAFCLYGMSEYYAASKDENALKIAIDLFQIIEEKSFDKERLGYFEAFDVDWKPLTDLRLSEKDNNDAKTMNTHLHVIEAYANLYKVWKNDLVKTRIIQLLEVFDKHIIGDDFHLKLFFDEAWNSTSTLISYGHDIEAAWLLQECAEIIEDNFWIAKMKVYAIKITDAARESLFKDGSLMYEFEPATNHFTKEKHWWVQAEAMVGFFNAWQTSDDEKYLQHSINVWKFIQQNIIDKKNGEWFWGVDECNEVMKNEDKVGPWKCPYHNSRACLELIKRIT